MSANDPRPAATLTPAAATLNSTLIVGIACGLLTFLVDVPRAQPSFGVSLELWLTVPLICLIRYGIPTAVISFLVALPLIWFFSPAGISYWGAFVATVMMVVVVSVVHATHKNRIMFSLFLAWLIIIPATLAYHAELFRFDLNAGLLVLVGIMLSQLIPTIVAQGLAQRPATLRKLWPHNFPLPQRDVLSLALLIRGFFVPLLLLPMLATALFFTTGSVYQHGKLVEAGASLFADDVIWLASEALPSSAVLDSQTARASYSEILTRDVDFLLGARAVTLPFNFRLDVISLSQAGALSDGFVLPDDFDPKTSIDKIYRRQFRAVTLLPEHSVALVVHVGLETSADTGLAQSMWGLIVAALLVMLAEFLYQRWINVAGRRFAKFTDELLGWVPGYSQMPHIPLTKGVVTEFDDADTALTQLLANMEVSYKTVASISEERKLILEQQQAVVSAFQEPMVVIDRQMQVDRSRSCNLDASLGLALTPILDLARQQVVDGDSVDKRADLLDAELRFIQSLTNAWQHGQPQFGIDFNSGSDVADRKHYLVSIGAIGDGGGSASDPNGLVLLFTDISLLLETQDTLAQTVKMAALGEVATGTAHQLNQPLNIIRMATANLKRSKALLVDGSANLIEKLNRIDAQVERAAQIIEAMKVLALEAKKEWRPLNIASVVEATVRRMQPQFSAAGAIVHYESDAQALYVKASNVNIETILHSILGNSIDAFTERHTANPELWVRELLVDDSYQLEITDNAGGIDAEMLGHIFDPFYTTKVQVARPGLGLSVVWRLVDSLGGEIHGENVDGGVCFRIRLPLVAAPLTP